MISKKAWGVAAPLLLSALVAGATVLVSPSPAVERGILAGLVLALAQSFLSTWALHWAWQKAFFYWVWGTGVLVRLLVFAATAFVVYSYTSLHLVAVLLSMVLATTIFLVIESWALLKKSNGFPSSPRTSHS